MVVCFGQFVMDPTLPLLEPSGSSSSSSSNSANSTNTNSGSGQQAAPSGQLTTPGESGRPVRHLTGGFTHTQYTL